MTPSSWLISLIPSANWHAPLLVVLGLILLAYGGHILVPATINLAQKLKLSPAVIAVIVIAGGTSAPELIVSVQAAFYDSPAIALGNVIGSNIANSWLVIGIGALIAPISFISSHAYRDGWVMVVLTSILLASLFMIGALTLLPACLLLVITLYYLRHIIKADEVSSEEEADPQVSLAKASMMSALAILSLLAGAEMVVSGGKTLAMQAGISEGVVGLTIVAIGTSLPEIAAVIASQLKGRTDIALGNVLGSNIFNIGLILGLAGLIKPLPMGAGIDAISLLFLLAVTASLMMLIYAKMTIQKRMAFVFVGFYFLFLNHQF